MSLSMGVVPPAPGKLRRPGFTYSRSSRSAVPGPRLERSRKRAISLMSNCSPNDECLTFTVRTGPQELLRISPTGLHVSYVVKYKNPAVGAAHPWLSPRSASAEAAETIRCYVDPLTSFSTFFESAEVLLDGEDTSLQLKNPGYLQGFYAMAQRIFMTEAERRKYFDIQAYVTDSRMRDDRDKNSEMLQKVLSNCDFDDKEDPVPRTVKLSIDGVPFFSYPKNFQLCRLKGQTPPPTFSYLPPNTELMLKLQR
jgi:hypothetical protein